MLPITSGRYPTQFVSHQTFHYNYLLPSFTKKESSADNVGKSAGITIEVKYQSKIFQT